MTWPRLFAYLRWLTGRAKGDRDLHDEIESYIAHDIEARMHAGASAAEARRTALVDLGGIEPVKERTRAARAGAAIDAVGQDLRYAVRTLRHAPGFSLSVIGSLAIGIAAVIAASALIESIAFRQAPGVVDPAALVQLTPYRRCDARRLDCLNMMATGSGEYRAILESGTDVFDGWLADTRGTVTAVLPQPRSLRAIFVSDGYFDVLGVRALLGRTFGVGDDVPANTAVCVIAHGLWVLEFGSDRAVIGRSIQLAGEHVTVIGVAPPGFGGLGSWTPDMWLPMSQADRVADALAPSASALPRGGRLIRYVGRMKPDVDLRRVRAMADLLGPRLQAASGDSTLPVWVDAAPYTRLDVARTLLIIGLLLPMPILVLAVGCVNAANLLLARASLRSREIAVRLAIGASRGRVVLQLLIESLMLALAATAAAAPIVWGVLRSASVYLELPMSIDSGLVAIGILTVTASAVGFGLIPAFRVTTAGPAGALVNARTKDGTPRQARARRTLVVVQIALSLGLLAVSLQLVNAMASEAASAGTPWDRLVLASFDLGQPGVTPDAASAFYARLLERAQALPQFEAAGLAPQRILWTLNRGRQADNSVAVWAPDDLPKGGRMYLGGYTGGRFFEAVGLRVLEGRSFSEDDALAPHPRVAVVNQPFARQVFQGRAMGRAVRVADVGAGHAASMEVQIVGVVEAALDPGFTRDGEPVPAVYLPAPLGNARRLTLLARASSPIDVAGPPLRAMVHEMNPRIPITQLRTLTSLNEETNGKQRWLARAGAWLGLGALLLATLGLYSLVSYVVAARGREFAIRMALGAAPREVLTMVVRQSMRLAMIGATVGGAAALGIGQVIRSEVHSAPAVDWAALAGSTALLVAAMTAASLVPGARAARVNPIGLLKEE